MEGSLWVACFLFPWMSVAGYQSVIIPREIQTIMAGVDNMAAFMKAMKIGNRTLSKAGLVIVKKRQPTIEKIKDVIGRPGLGVSSGKPGQVPRPVGSPGSKPLYKFGRSKVLSLGERGGPTVMLENVNCESSLQVVAVPQPQHSHGFYYPSHVRLNRCAGGCTHKPRLMECAPTEIQNISVIVFSVAWSSGRSVSVKRKIYRSALTVRMTNHTKCGCQCVTKPSDCDLTKQYYEKDNCRCVCKPRTIPCQYRFQWDQIQCKCVCNPYHIPKCPERQEWHSDICRCGCKRNLCKVRAKIRNPRTCRCLCPSSIKCKRGETRDRRTCACVKARGKSRRHLLKRRLFNRQ